MKAQTGPQDKSGANTPALASNMIPVYYNKSDNNWHKAEASNTISKYKWYDYNNKMWANAVTVVERSSYKSDYVYNQKISSNSTVSLKNTSTSSYEEVVTESYEYTVDNNKNYFHCPNKLSRYNDIYAADDNSCMAASGSTISISKGYYLVDPDDKSSQYLPKSLKSNDGTNSVFVTTKYSIKEKNKVYDKKYVASSFSFDKVTGKYTLSNPELAVYSSSYVNYYTCDSTTESSCTTMYKLKTMTEGSVTVADKYTSVWERKGNTELILPDGSKKACINDVCTRDDYINAPNGTVIPMDDINTMFVWIPRYKYTYFSSSTPAEISIMFEKGTESTGTIKCTDTIVASSKKSENCTDAVNGSLTVGKSTYTHPAFTFGEEKLTGIWVGKFESGGTYIRPDSFVSELPLDIFFETSREMELANNIYGFPQSGTTLNKVTGEISGDSNKLDTHLIKNMEWGAVAYFSHSKYGTCADGVCKEIGINNKSDYTTGYGAESGSAECTTCNFYNTVEGMKASTTGNIYGIYDMSGGLPEYVMGNMQDVSNAFYPGLADTWSITQKPLDKYYDKYSYDETESMSEYSYGKLGDATVELQPDASSWITWYGDLQGFFTAGYPWASRGGDASSSTDAGLFNLMMGEGNDYADLRTVLSISS